MLYINGRFLLQDLTGVTRFAYEMCMALHRAGKHFVLLCPDGRLNDSYDVSELSIEQFGAGKSHFWEQVCLPVRFKTKKGRNILLNFTGIGPVLVRNKIVTIHDISFMVDRRWFSFSYYLLYRILTPLSASTSRIIITVSEFSKSEINRRLGVRADKIRVIHNAVSGVFARGGGPGIPGNRYILAVSSIDPRKNFRNLLLAFSEMKSKDLDLYLIGGQNAIFSADANELRRTIDSERIKWLGRVSDEELRRYYEHALYFIYPSLYEGFGLPPLEAMSCGTPVIASSIPPLKEVCGDAALYVNPADVGDMAAKMDMLAENADLRALLRDRGLARQHSFSWDKSAAQLTEILAEV